MPSHIEPAAAPARDLLGALDEGVEDEFLQRGGNARTMIGDAELGRVAGPIRVHGHRRAVRRVADRVLDEVH